MKNTEPLSHARTKKVDFVGDWVVQLRSGYAETPFDHADKGLDFIN
jgi:hypothetical protein